MEDRNREVSRMVCRNMYPASSEDLSSQLPSKKSIRDPGCKPLSKVNCISSPRPCVLEVRDLCSTCREPVYINDTWSTVKIYCSRSPNWSRGAEALILASDAEASKPGEANMPENNNT